MSESEWNPRSGCQMGSVAEGDESSNGMLLAFSERFVIAVLT